MGGLGCAALGLEATPTLTATTSVTLSPTRTLTPTPTATPTPQLSDIEVMVEIEIPNEDRELPADTRTTALVIVRVSAPEGVEIEGRTVNFIVEGSGSVNLNSTQIQNGEATTIYTTGESTGFENNLQTGRSPARIRVEIDVPNLGRASASTEFYLVRQELFLADLPDCLSTMAYTGTPLNVPFALRADDDLMGQYAVRIAAEQGQVSFSSTPSSALQLVDIKLGAHEFTYTPPTQPEFGQDRVCISLPQRQDLAEQCVPMLWSPPVERLAIMMSNGIWGIEEKVFPNFNVRAYNNALEFQENLITYRFTPLAYLEAPADGVWLQPDEFQPPLAPDQCHVFKANNRNFSEVNQEIFTVFSRQAWIAHWEFNAPGLASPDRRDMIIASFAREWRVNSPVRVANGSIVLLHPYAPDYLYYSGIRNADGTWPVIVRFLVPERSIDTERKILRRLGSENEFLAISSVRAYQNYQASERRYNIMVNFEGMKFHSVILAQPPKLKENFGVPSTSGARVLINNSCNNSKVKILDSLFAFFVYHVNIQIITSPVNLGGWCG